MAIQEGVHSLTSEVPLYHTRQSLSLTRLVKNVDLGKFHIILEAHLSRHTALTLTAKHALSPRQFAVSCHTNTRGDAANATRWDSRVSLARYVERNVTKFAPHKALKAIA